MRCHGLGGDPEVSSKEPVGEPVHVVPVVPVRSESRHVGFAWLSTFQDLHPLPAGG